MTALPGTGRLLEDQQEAEVKLPGTGRLLEAQEPPKEAEPEGWLDWAKRLGAQGASVAGERIAGLPGDIREGVGNLAIKGYENFGFGIPTPKDFGSAFEAITTPNDKQREAPQWLKDTLLGSQQFKDMQPPTSGEIRSDIAKATGGYTEPKNYAEEKYRNLLGDYIDLTNPASKFSPGRKLAIAAGSEFLGDVAEAISGKESDKVKAKGTAVLALSILNPGGARKYTESLYKDVRDAVPPNATTNALRTVNKINSYERGLMQSGISTPTKSAALTPLTELKQKIQQGNGQISIHGLLNAKAEINELRKKYYAETGAFADRAKGRKEFGKVMNIVDEAIEDGLNTMPNINKAHPLDTFKEANQSWSTLHEAESASNFIKKHMPEKLRGNALAALFEIGYKHPGLVMKTAGASAAGLGILTGARVLTQIKNSPTLRRYYTDAFKAALKGDAKLTTTLLSKLSDEWEKENQISK